MKISAATAAGTCVMSNGLPAFAAAKFPEAKAAEFVELPPANAETYDTACRYCHVMCGYKVHIWPKGTGRKPESEKFYPVEKMRGDWPNPAFTIEAKKNGKDVNIMIVPDNKDVQADQIIPSAALSMHKVCIQKNFRQRFVSRNR